MKLELGAYDKKILVAGVVLLAAIVATYSNHFENGFHFDDSHTIIENDSIQDASNIPRIFTDAKYFSSLPDHQVYQPVTATSLALDYWIAGGLKPFYFQLSTFFWFLVLLALMFFLFRRIMDTVDSHPWNWAFALLAVACYGLHPAIAETVNYIIQRADVLSTLGVVGSMFLYAVVPNSRKWALYMIPAVIGMLAKAPALIFPFILVIYVFLFEVGGTFGIKDWAENRKKWIDAFKATLPAFVVTIAVAGLIYKMTPATFVTGATAPALYRATQPLVALRYLKSFFLPTELSADTDWSVVSSLDSTDAFIGYLFVIGMIWLAMWLSRKEEMRPISFGIIWFLLALIPTSITALAEVTNDHRMFFPFIGLALAVVWSVRLIVFKQTERLTTRLDIVKVSAVVGAAILVVAAYGTHERNSVWHTDESLWKDVILKSPKNGRGLMNYGLTQMEKGGTDRQSRTDNLMNALKYFEQAQIYAPSYPLLEINLGVADAGLDRDIEAERHFQRALALAPNIAASHFFYGRWLKEKGRTGEAIAQLEAAVRANPDSRDARDLLMRTYSEQNNWPAFQRVADDTLKRAPNDPTPRQLTEERENRDRATAVAEQEAHDN
ncbi:MAG TPA: tetratricopeptide repeat protein, partial [Blastocatellia bacterium]